ncbi:uncharacterized protein LOC121261463 [Juglans microcarpa x Juglans regia]|uniref:uncharacterized protein LOC121261463 n=1 Tax=Juglans microcarpa x Juglans regia TaxID=2249226 RepID=UPI001B7E941C|nr:uncharacterized protein LOC121261463 [Juglans microcarpa x Juglans regia]
MNDLEEQWRKFCLIEEEGEAIAIDDVVDEVIGFKGDCSLVGKICLDRNIGRMVLEDTMKKVWRVSKPAKFGELGGNVFTITFANQADKQRIWNGRPWLFDSHLLALKLFDEYTPLQRMRFDKESFWIGGTIGKVEEVDTKEDGVGWGKFLRVCINIELMKPLARGRTITMKGEKLWIPVKYEKLPRFCFECGCLIHGPQGCTGKLGEKLQYGVWLRADTKIGSKLKIRANGFESKWREVNEGEEEGVRDDQHEAEGEETKRGEVEQNIEGEENTPGLRGGVESNEVESSCANGT